MCAQTAASPRGAKFAAALAAKEKGGDDDDGSLNGELNAEKRAHISTWVAASALDPDEMGKRAVSHTHTHTHAERERQRKREREKEREREREREREACNPRVSLHGVCFMVRNMQAVPCRRFAALPNPNDLFTGLLVREVWNADVGFMTTVVCVTEDPIEDDLDAYEDNDDDQEATDNKQQGDDQRTEEDPGDALDEAGASMNDFKRGKRLKKLIRVMESAQVCTVRISHSHSASCCVQQGREERTYALVLVARRYVNT